MSDASQNEPMIFVDFGDGELQQVSRNRSNADNSELAKKSEDATQRALDSINWVAEQAKKLKLHEQADTVELEFGIKITAQAGVIVAKAESEFHIQAKLVWNKKA